MDEKQSSWIAAHVHMYEYFGGVAKILVPDNCRTAVDHNKGWKDQRITAALRNGQFFSLSELNRAIRQKLEVFSRRPFQKKEGSRYEIFRDEELPLLALYLPPLMNWRNGPSHKSIKNILDTGSDRMEAPDKTATGNHTEPAKSSHALTRGADYYRR